MIKWVGYMYESIRNCSNYIYYFFHPILHRESTPLAPKALLL